MNFSCLVVSVVVSPILNTIPSRFIKIKRDRVTSVKIFGSNAYTQINSHTDMTRTIGWWSTSYHTGAHVIYRLNQFEQLRSSFVCLIYSRTYASIDLKSTD